MATLLLEVGTEPMPAEVIPPALAQLADAARARLGAERIAFEALNTWGTPRRLALLATGVAARQAAAAREVRGPAVQAAFAANGEPTQAALGFARSQGVAVSDLRIKRLDAHEYVVATFRDEGRPTLELLPALLPELIAGLTFPKTMRWEESGFRFARPIRWLVALLDDEVAPFTLAGVTAGRVTRGHLLLAPHELSLACAADYRRVLDENFVLVAPEERREVMRTQVEAIARQAGADIVDDGALLDTTTFLLEYPTAVGCAFDEQLLSLPREVLLWVLREEQSFFPLAAPQGDLLPAFVAVRNGDKSYLSSVRAGFERVAHAKLLDALFFYEQDVALPLDARLDALAEMVFHERAGTLRQKAERLHNLAGEIATLLGFSLDVRATARHAALLAKVDLATAMVAEYPALQGAMGRIYARASGEPEAVAAAIGEHYLPRVAGDPIPAGEAGRIVALADKLDTLAASFAVGLSPTGSEDPYALRREALGVARILVEAPYRLSLARLIDMALARLDLEETLSADEVRAPLAAFVRGRVEHLLAAEGLPAPVIQAALAVSADVPADAARRARIIHRHLDDPIFRTVARAGVRLEHIAPEAPAAAIPEEALTEYAERELFIRYRDAAPQAALLAEQGDFEGLLALLFSLAPSVDRFFEQVLVMTEDAGQRRARLALLKAVADLFCLLGDLSCLEG